MISQKYLNQIQSLLLEVFPSGVKIFVFGSSVDPQIQQFLDVDIAVEGDFDDSFVRKAKEILEESTIPYKIDLVNFNSVESDFKQRVLKRPIKWLT